MQKIPFTVLQWLISPLQIESNHQKYQPSLVIFPTTYFFRSNMFSCIPPLQDRITMSRYRDKILASFFKVQGWIFFLLLATGCAFHSLIRSSHLNWFVDSWKWNAYQEFYFRHFNVFTLNAPCDLKCLHGRYSSCIPVTPPHPCTSFPRTIARSQAKVKGTNTRHEGLPISLASSAFPSRWEPFFVPRMCNVCSRLACLVKIQ